MTHVSLVVTSISQPTAPLLELARGARDHGLEFILIGDEASPPHFVLEGCRFYAIDEQRKLDLATARLCPARHYARKNIGYLLALLNGADVIVETDDDNIPTAGFWGERQRHQAAFLITRHGWLNPYRYFSEENIWPRGLPLDEIHRPVPAATALLPARLDCPIQQGLADENPDVDAIYRLLMPLPQSFHSHLPIGLGAGTWCPFNSQNTTWWREAAPLLYLPSHCSFRMTDIWRGFVAQRIAWENGWSVLFHGATVRQDRNAHDLMRDFADEVPGYLHNKAIAAALDALTLRGGIDHIGKNMLSCYAELHRIGVMEARELDLLAAWLADLAFIGAGSRT